MSNWTYLVVQVPPQGLTQDWLNGFGSQGWELVAVNATFNAIVIFKKPSA